MTPTMAAPHSTAARAFRFRSGRRCLDFAATLGGRHRTPIERLPEPADLGRWFTASGLIAEAPRVSDEELHSARALREAIYRLARRRIADDRPDPDDLAVLNGHAAAPPLIPALGRDGAVTWSAPDPVAAALSVVARDAVDLLGGPEAHRVRECARTDCSLLFVDVSPASDRRWCAMGGCGNREKVRRYRQRRRAAESPPDPRI